MAHCYKRILVKWYFIVWWQTLFMSVCVHTCTCLLACACLQSKLTKGRWRKRWHHPHRKFHHDLLRCPHRPVGPLCSWEACEQSPPPPPHIYWYIHSKSKCSPEPFYLSWSMQVKVKPSGSKPFWGLLYLLKTWLESLAFHSSYQAWKKVAFFSRLQPVRHPPINNVGESGALKLSAGVFFLVYADGLVLEPDMSAGFCPDHKAAMVLFLERVYGIEDQNFLLYLLEVGFLPDMRAAASLETVRVKQLEMTGEEHTAEIKKMVSNFKSLKHWSFWGF